MNAPTIWPDEEINLVAARIKAIAQPSRLAIVCLLGGGEQTVGDIAEALGSTQPNISQHLRQLHNQRLLSSRRDANRIYYAIDDTRIERIVEMLREIYCK